jgi:hypothetical protein
MTRQFDVMLRRIKYTNQQLNLSRAEPSWRARRAKRSRGWAPKNAFALAVATGTATVLTMGTELCRRGDVLRIYRQICAEQVGVAA